MSGISFDSHGSIRAMRAEFQRLAAPPVKTIAQLETELKATFLDTQAATHIITGSLKLSGRSSSDFDGKTWEADIEYGGPSAGPNNPVDYAIYEMARGGHHDFLAPVELHEQAFESIINSHFDGMLS